MNLQEAPVFQEAAAFWEPYAAETTFARAYVNTRALGPLLRDSAYPDLKEAGDLLQGVDYGVSVSRLTDRGVEMLARSRHGYDRLHQLVRSSVDAAAAPNHSLHLLAGAVARLQLVRLAAAGDARPGPGRRRPEHGQGRRPSASAWRTWAGRWGPSTAWC